MATYRYAPEVRNIAAPLIEAHHDHLKKIRIEFVFRSEAARSGGQLVLGKARKVSGLNALLSLPEAEIEDVDETTSDDQDFFVVEIAHDTWMWMEDKQRRALVDHELCHCRIEYDDDGALKLVVAAHDVEEFAAVVERWGLWKPDLTRFVRAIGSTQLALFVDMPPSDPNDFDPRRRPDDEPDGAFTNEVRRWAASLADTGATVTVT